MRKTPDAAALISSNLNPDEDDDGHHQYLGDIVEEAAYILKYETVLLSINDVVIDNGSTIHLVRDPKLLTIIQSTTKPNGVRSNAAGARVHLEGKLRDIGTVY
jgi:hypothetical protein